VQEYFLQKEKMNLNDEEIPKFAEDDLDDRLEELNLDD